MRLLLFAALAYLFYRVLRSVWVLGKGKKRRVPKNDNRGAVDEMVQDPFCKAYFPLRDSERRVIGGEEHLFCSKKCADEYERRLKA